MSKKTIAELEKLLNEPEEHPIIILPDGSLTVDRQRKGKGFIKTTDLTISQNSSY